MTPLDPLRTHQNIEEVLELLLDVLKMLLEVLEMLLEMLLEMELLATSRDSSRTFRNMRLDAHALIIVKLGKL